MTATGPDAETFLQGQLTQDLGQLDVTAALPAAWCNPKGRVVSTMRLFRRDDGFGLILPAGHAQTVLQRISIYRLRADVELQIRADIAFVPLHDFDSAKAGLEPGARPDSVVCNGGVTAIRLSDAVLELFGEPSAVDALDLAGRIDDARWRSETIRAGRVVIDASVSEKYTPHMLSLDLAGAISFDKGCYTGQEVVARTEHLGKSRRRLMRYTSEISDPQPGDQLLDDGRAVGAVVNASGHDVLAVTPADLHTKTLTLAGGAATPASLAYAKISV